MNTLARYILLAQFLGGIIASWILLNVFQKGFTLAANSALSAPSATKTARWGLIQWRRLINMV